MTIQEYEDILVMLRKMKNFITHTEEQMLLRVLPDNLTELKEDVFYFEHYYTVKLNQQRKVQGE